MQPYSNSVQLSAANMSTTKKLPNEVVLKILKYVYQDENVRSLCLSSDVRPASGVVCKLWLDFTLGI